MAKKLPDIKAINKKGVQVEIPREWEYDQDRLNMLGLVVPVEQSSDFVATQKEKPAPTPAKKKPNIILEEKKPAKKPAPRKPAKKKAPAKIKRKGTAKKR